MRRKRAPKQRTRTARYEEFRRAFGNAVASARHAQKYIMSQNVLAERAHVTVNTIGKIERGQQSPTLEVLFDIADALGISAIDLLEGLDTPPMDGE